MSRQVPEPTIPSSEVQQTEREANYSHVFSDVVKNVGALPTLSRVLSLRVS
jgi:hypothetical protein